MTFPANAVLLSTALTVGAVAFCLRLVWPVGAAVWHLQLGYFASYALLFAVGCLAADRGWFEKLPEAQVRLWRRVTWVALPTLLPLAFLATRFPVLHAPATGGFSVPALMYALWEPFVAWGILLSVLAWAARPARPPSPLARQLARRAYGIFVIHPVVVVGVALAWRAVAAPALLKFAVTGAVSCVLCFWIVGLLLRLPIVRRVL